MRAEVSAAVRELVGHVERRDGWDPAVEVSPDDVKAWLADRRAAVASVHLLEPAWVSMGDETLSLPGGAHVGWAVVDREGFPLFAGGTLADALSRAEGVPSIQ